MRSVTQPIKVLIQDNVVDLVSLVQTTLLDLACAVLAMSTAVSAVVFQLAVLLLKRVTQREDVFEGTCYFWGSFGGKAFR